MCIVDDSRLFVCFKSIEAGCLEALYIYDLLT